MHGIRGSLPTTYLVLPLTTDSFSSAVGPDCKLLAYTFVCVGVPGTLKPDPLSKTQPQQPGTIANCKKYYKVKSGQGCWDIQQSEHVSLSDWAKCEFTISSGQVKSCSLNATGNPLVNANCGNLLPNVYVVSEPLSYIRCLTSITI
jgi:hypothetical protein